MADFALIQSPKLISRKIWIIEKSWIFHTVQIFLPILILFIFRKFVKFFHFHINIIFISSYIIQRRFMLLDFTVIKRFWPFSCRGFAWGWIFGLVINYLGLGLWLRYMWSFDGFFLCFLLNSWSGNWLGISCESFKDYIFLKSQLFWMNSTTIEFSC